MIKSYWLRILLCGIGCAIIGFVIALLTPKQYDGFFQVLVAPYAPPIPRATTEADESVEDLLSASAPRTVNTQVEILTSFHVISDAAQKAAETFGKLPIRTGDEFDPFEVQERVGIQAQKESDIVTLRVRMSDPDYAREMAGQIYQAFEAANERQSKEGANRAIEFLNSQTSVVKEQLAALDAESAKVKTNLGAPNIDALTQSEIQSIEALQQQVQLARATKSDADAQVASLRAELQSGLISPTIEAGTGTGLDPRRTDIQQALIGARADRAQALERYEKDSEPVQSIDRRIEQLQKDLKTYDKEYVKTGSSVAPNPLYQSLKGQLTQAISVAAGAAQKLSSLEASYAAKQADIAKLPDLQRKIQELFRKQQVLERINALYTSKLNTLELAKQGRRSSASLITAATAMPKPSVPNTNLNVGLGMILGLGIGFLWSVATESKRNPIRSLGQLNRLALQPAYRVIPELRVPMRGLTRPTAEVFEALLVNFVRSEKKGYRIGVLGVTKNAGATTTAMNLAIAAARGGYSVLYVEVDPGNNALTKLTPAAGDVKSPGTNITIYNASLGETTANGTMGLPSDLEEAAKGKDLVIFDFAPVKASGDAFLIANQLDEMIMLVRANQTKSVDFLQAQQALIDSGCPLVSVTLSRVQEQADDIAALEQQPEMRAISP